MSDEPQQSWQESASDRSWYEYVSTSYGQPPYGGLPPGPPYPPAPSGRSHRRLWITLGIVGIVLVLFVCGGCVAASFIGIRYVQQNFGPVLVATRYYEALKEQEYSLAYSYLDAHALVQGQRVSLTLFTRQAQIADMTRGKVVRAVPTSITTTGNMAWVVMQVTRKQQAYAVSLQLRKESNGWRIVSANRI